jgi:hypothetical protein
VEAATTTKTIQNQEAESHAVLLESESQTQRRRRERLRNHESIPTHHPRVEKIGKVQSANTSKTVAQAAAAVKTTTRPNSARTLAKEGI